MSLLTTTKKLIKAQEMYDQLKYIKANKPDLKMSEKNINNLEDQYDELLENMQEMYNFSDTENNRDKMYEFEKRYSQKVKQEFTNAQTRVQKDNVRKVKPLDFGKKEKVEEKKIAKA